MSLSNLETLKSVFRGPIFQEGDDAYPAARRIWNASIVKRPAVIAKCSGLADVVAAIHFARENQLLTAIKGGGHNVGGRALCDGGIVIDVSELRAVHVDQSKSTVRIQGGTTLGDLDRETHVFGLAAPSGIAPTTGMAGLTLGGGVGWLVRKYGMSIDNLLSCQIVTAEGEVLNASATENPDLFWALRGGGGNFGVVTSLEYQAHPVKTVLGGLILYPRAAAVEVLQNFRDYIESAPDELTAYVVLLHGPDGTPMVGVAACYCGAEAQSTSVLQPLRNFGNPIADTFHQIPFPVMQNLFGTAFPHGQQNYWKSSLHQQLSDEMIQTLVEHANLMTSPRSAVAIENYGGAAGRIANDATAFPHRDLPWDVIALAVWTDPTETQHRDWARALESALRPFSTGEHLLGALDVETDDVISSAFGINLPRLREVKTKFDPGNFFRVNQNIKPLKQRAAVR